MWEEPLALPRPSLDARDFRSALGCFPTGVCLVTTVAPDGRRAGLTANSFSSVSLDPPMVLWSLARTATSAPVFRDAEYFVINVLAAGDAELSSHFARPGEDKFAKYAERFVGGVLRGAVATFECHSRHRYYGGDHIILIGNVERYSWSDAAPLVFHRGRYA
jgi:flavin reductase (DIM6/NTAB) family NADH-FMN oxidoreductase RutF